MKPCPRFPVQIFRIIISTQLFMMSAHPVSSQKPVSVRIQKDDARHVVTVTADGKPFTSFIYPDSLEKPVLYPVFAADGQVVTRGFPLEPRPGEPTDHPHHIGIWFNYENVNGLDFWNNSYAIPAEKKNKYGWIKVKGVKIIPGENFSELEFNADWVNQSGDILLKEKTLFRFYGFENERFIVRSTTLTAEQDVAFNDAKDGLMAIRVTHELELPSAQPKEFKDDKGNITKVEANAGGAANGNYITSEGKTGDSAWSTRAAWCMMYGKKGKDTLSILILDDPGNPGYPTYWHARGYGLFSANPLGQKIFSNGKETMNFKLMKNESARFKYTIVIGSGKKRISDSRIRELIPGTGKAGRTKKDN